MSPTSVAQSPRIVVIGGGITGLAAALRLQELARNATTAIDLTLLEASDRTGGKLWTEYVGDFIIDAGPDIFLANKPHGMALCESLGMADRMQSTNPATRTTYVRRGETLHAETLYADLPLVTPRRGMRELVDTAAAALTDATIVTDAEVTALEQTASGYRIVTSRGDSLEAQGIIIAVPAHPASTLLKRLSPEAATCLAEVPYTEMTTVSAAYRASDVTRVLDGYGYVNADLVPGAVTACTWTSTKIPGRAPHDTVLVRGYIRGHVPDAEALVLQDIHAVLGITASPLFTRSYHWRDAVPLYDPEHPARVTAMRKLLSGFPGLAIAGGALDGAGIPDSIGSGTTAADAVWTAIIEHSSISHD